VNGHQININTFFEYSSLIFVLLVHLYSIVVTIKPQLGKEGRGSQFWKPISKPSLHFDKTETNLSIGQRR
jgi:hypothetical protein